MNLKSRILGFTAASIFALSMTTGVMAEESDLPTPSTTASVTLSTGSCSMSINGDSSSIDFGSLTWNGSAWNNDVDKQTITASVKNGQPNQTCDIQAMSAGLSGPGEDGDQNIGLSVNDYNLVETEHRTVVKDSGTDPSVDITVELGDVSNDHAAGTYRGQIDFKVINGN